MLLKSYLFIENNANNLKTFIFVIFKIKSDLIVEIILAIAACETFADHPSTFKGNHIDLQLKLSDVFGAGHNCMRQKYFADLGRETEGYLSRGSIV